MTHFVIGEEGKEEELNDFIEDEPQEERNDEKDTFSEDDDDEISDEELQGKKKGRSRFHHVSLITLTYVSRWKDERL